MTRLCHRMLAVCSVVLSVGLGALLPGCDWLSGSDNVGRTSPYLSKLTIGKTIVSCGKNNTFTVSFDYDDPQGDIANALVTFINKDVVKNEDGTRKEVVTKKVTTLSPIPWPPNISRAIGVWNGQFAFVCDADDVEITDDPLLVDVTDMMEGTGENDDVLDPKGDWSIEVTVLDDKGHESNVLQGRIKLL